MAELGTGLVLSPSLHHTSDIQGQKPPFTLDEFLRAENLDDWPLLVNFENPLDCKLDDLLGSTQEDIQAVLDDAAPLNLPLLTALDERLSAFEDKLKGHAGKIITLDKEQPPSDNSIDVTESVQTSGQNPAKVLTPQKYNVSTQNQISRNYIPQSWKSLDEIIFPGFVAAELIKLPDLLEAAPILNQITLAQHFHHEFQKIWKKIFLSEASSAILQDAFWWIFLDKFSHQEVVQHDKDLLFDRISDSYVALFTNISIDMRDKFLSVYPDCLSQSLYCTFCEAFPESTSRFDVGFKQYLVNLIHQWITGLLPVPETWKRWHEPMLKLQQVSRQREAIKKSREIAMMKTKAIMPELKATGDAYISTCDVIEKLGADSTVLHHGHLSRETTKMSREKLNSATTECYQTASSLELERFKFNPAGTSPLVAHFLFSQQRLKDHQLGPRLTRTEIVKLPSENSAYQELTLETLKKSEALSADYIRVHKQINADILELKQQQKIRNKEINKLKRALIRAKTAQERCLALEAVLEFQAYEQKQQYAANQTKQNLLTQTESDSPASSEFED